MTDDEILAEVAAMRGTGNRGESGNLQGTPEGSYLSIVAPAEARVVLIGPAFMGFPEEASNCVNSATWLAGGLLIPLTNQTEAGLAYFRAVPTSAQTE